MPTPSTSAQNRPSSMICRIAKVPGEVRINVIPVNGALALLEQLRVAQRRLLAFAQALALRMFRKIADHVLGQPLRFRDIRADHRAVSALMRDRYL